MRTTIGRYFAWAFLLNRQSLPRIRISLSTRRYLPTLPFGLSLCLRCLVRNPGGTGYKGAVHLPNQTHRTRQPKLFRTRDEVNGGALEIYVARLKNKPLPCFLERASFQVHLSDLTVARILLRAAVRPHQNPRLKCTVMWSLEPWPEAGLAKHQFNLEGSEPANQKPSHGWGQIVLGNVKRQRRDRREMSPLLPCDTSRPSRRQWDAASRQEQARR